jgi:RNA polymerase sigma factor (sigma-70 family)
VQSGVTFRAIKARRVQQLALRRGTAMSSVTSLIGSLRTGSPAAFEQVFQRFFPTLVSRLERRLGSAYPGVEGPEDVALSIFRRLWNVVSGQSPLAAGLSDQRGLLRILSVLTRQKLREAHRYEHRLQRDRRRTRREADCSSARDTCSSVQEATANDRPGDWDVAFLDLLTHLLGQLSERQQAVALRKLDGLTSREIAGELRCSERAVERHLSEIRDRWRFHPDLADALRSAAATGKASPA